MPTPRPRVTGRRAVLFAVLLGLAAALLGSAPAQAFSLIPGENVTTESGVVQGVVSLDHREFRGIPFAAPPVGNRRFAAPQPAASWKGERSARSFGPACPQAVPFLGIRYPTSSEDCLYLDVRTPPQAKSKNLPVMVWFYGGAYLLGSTDQYDPTPLVTQGNVIVVSVSYRVGPFGFLSVPGGTANAGLLDQQAGLRWVQRNIAAFGGNPGNVTIFGESAGGNSVCQQLASPTSAGLFHKAIVESGACGSSTLDGENLAAAQAKSADYAASVGCPDAAAVLTCLRGRSVAQLLASPSARFESMTVGWRPVVDGVTETSGTGTAFAAGAQHQVPVLIGGNHDEGRLFVALFHHLKGLGRVDRAGYEADVREVFGDRTDAILARYADIASPDLALGTVWTDGLFACSTSLAMQSLARTAPAAYAYEFDDTDVPLQNLDPLMPLRSYHGSELFYLMDKALALPTPILNAKQKALSRQMIGYWTTFARTGDPNGGGRPTWPQASSGNLLKLTTQGAGPAPSSLAAFAADHRCDAWT
ncbi:carboxylesterase/lipase family protein [Spongisporangium articulatum]|uniref:Carboxylic ester hydrolase n=1 Tax=Spongisporangium articulatum TaxID=3362603 RepID=A0ABW8AK77_9ACTN